MFVFALRAFHHIGVAITPINDEPGVVRVKLEFAATLTIDSVSFRAFGFAGFQYFHVW